MKALLRSIVAVLLFASGSASAEPPQTVRWTRLETAPGVETNPASAIGPLAGNNPQPQYINKSLRWRTLEKGSAMLNLRTGFLFFRLEGLSTAQEIGELPIGAPIGGDPALLPQASVKATVVCYAKHPGLVVFVDTPTVFLDEHGTGSFEGFVNLPPECAELPGEIVFLIRHDNPNAPIDGLYFVYGAGRVIR